MANQYPSLDELSDACAASNACPSENCVQAAPAVASHTCPPTVGSTASCGYTLPNGFTDPVEDLNGEGITILGRLGQKLAKFSGSGFIQIVCGKARIVPNIAMNIRSLWHKWAKADTLNGDPVLGDAYPFPYQVIADSNGDMFLVSGKQDEDSVTVWDSENNEWTVRDVADFPVLVRGQQTQVSEIELSGFAPMSASDACDKRRGVVVLGGEGILYSQAVPTADCGDPCDAARLTSVSKFLPFPTGQDTYVLKYNLANGPFWEVES